MKNLEPLEKTYDEKEKIETVKAIFIESGSAGATKTAPILTKSQAQYDDQILFLSCSQSALESVKKPIRHYNRKPKISSGISNNNASFIYMDPVTSRLSTK